MRVPTSRREAPRVVRGGEVLSAEGPILSAEGAGWCSGPVLDDETRETIKHNHLVAKRKREISDAERAAVRALAFRRKLCATAAAQIIVPQHLARMNIMRETLTPDKVQFHLKTYRGMHLTDNSIK